MFTNIVSVHYVVIPCQCPPAPANGTTSSCSGPVQAGTQLYYNCNSGYYREGSSYRTCLPYGNWTDPPTCKTGMLQQLLLWSQK